MMNRLLQAARFAAEKHTRQRRKNADASPYINHPIEVAEHLARIGGISDEDILIAALLHDTIEDTDTTYQEIAEIFGERVANILLECTDDKSPEAKCVKIADKTCNLSSILADPPRGWSIQRQKEYFAWAARVIDGLLGKNDSLDAYVREVLARGKVALDRAEAESTRGV